ncbi:MAG: zeta toxin family protein, partial [Bifidobacteriaceae bacterium]|nr:zeta toxin family protein [Bifidobacteriaceae bacterium]
MKLPPEEQLIRHARTLQALHLPGGDLRFDSPWATRRRPEWHKPSKPRRERAAVLHRLIGEWAAGRPEALAERRALVLAGPPGAGKTSRRGEALAALGEDPAGYAVIDSDVFKELLIREALRDGTWPQLVPDSVWQREADGERFYPMELSALFHSEAAILVMYAQMKWVLPAGVNVVLEGVHPNPAAATRMVALLDSYDYQVATATVETAERECLVRSVARWAAGY